MVQPKYLPAQKEQLLKGYPVINSRADTKASRFFSLIEKIDEHGISLIKIGRHFQRSAIQNLDKIWSKRLSAQEITWSTNNTSDYLHLLNVPIEANTLKLEDNYSCVYSLTSTEVPYVTHIPLENKQRNPNFIVVGGLSGVEGKAQWLMA